MSILVIEIVSLVAFWNTRSVQSMLSSGRSERMVQMHRPLRLETPRKPIGNRMLDRNFFFDYLAASRLSSLQNFHFCFNASKALRQSPNRVSDIHSYLLSLPALTDLSFSGWHSDMPIDLIYANGGSYLRRLSILTMPLELLSCRDIQNIVKNCPFTRRSYD
jgi:hypothetical protein